VYGSCVKS